MGLNILDVCEATPNKRHWIPSKEYQIWAKVLKTRNLPDNVTLRISAPMVDGPPPKAWQNTSTVTAGDNITGHACPRLNKMVNAARAAPVGTGRSPMSHITSTRTVLRGKGTTLAVPFSSRCRRHRPRAQDAGRRPMIHMPRDAGRRAQRRYHHTSGRGTQDREPRTVQLGR